MNYCSYVMAKKTEGIQPYLSSVLWSKLEQVSKNEDILHPAVRGLLIDYFDYRKGVEISCYGDLPARTGIGSSSTFVVGLLNALSKLLNNTNASKDHLAHASIHIERELLKESGGIQDQIWAAYGGLNSIEIETSGEFHVRPLPVSQSFIDIFESSSLLVYLGVQRDSFDVAKSHDSTNTHVLNYKKEIHAVAHEALRAFHEENLEYLGKLLHRTWMIKRNISHLVSSSEVDKVYSKCIELGAFGGKLLGSGKSGFLFVILPEEKKEDFMAKIGHKCLPVKVNFDGSKIIYA